MLLHVDDVTPGENLFTWLPHTTFDDLISQNALSPSVLMWFFRHSEKYNPTLSKLIAGAGTQGRDQLSKAYNVCIDRRYLVRFEFGISVPSGADGRIGQRYTVMCASRVRITDELLADLVRRHTPGKYVVVPWGEPDESGAREQRRVKVMSAEVYSYRGTEKITAHVCAEPCAADCDRAGEPELSAHTGRSRGKTSTKSAPKPPEWAPAMAAKRAAKRAGSTPAGPVAPESGNPTSGVTSANTAPPLVAPESGNPTSGVTSANTPPLQVAPEFGFPESIKKNNEKNNPVEQARADCVGDPAGLRPSGPNTSAAASVSGPDPVDPLVGDLQTACARDDVREPGDDDNNASTTDDSPASNRHRFAGAGALAVDRSPGAAAERERILSGRRARGLSWSERRRKLPSDPDARRLALGELDQVRRDGTPRAAGAITGGVDSPAVSDHPGAPPAIV